MRFDKENAVYINGVEFGNEQYANGETIFREVEIKGDRVDIEVLATTSGSLLVGAIAYLYILDEFVGEDIKITIYSNNLELVYRVNLIKDFYKMLGIKNERLSILRVNLNEKPFYKKLNSYDTDRAIRFESNDSIMDVLLERLETKADSLSMYYIPYGRMDRKVANKIFALKYFAKIINAFHFKCVYTCDLHNGTSRLINNLVEIPVGSLIKRVIDIESPDIFCFPDGGAYEKYPDELLKVGIDIKDKCVYGVKRRDEMESSNIVHYDLKTNGLDLRGKRVLIIDDICSTGSTMMKAANLLRKQRVERISMYVTHCEKSVLNGGLLESNLFNIIYTSNSLPAILNERIIRLQCNEPRRIS